MKSGFIVLSSVIASFTSDRRKAIKVLRDTLEKMLKEGCTPSSCQNIIYSENEEISITKAIELNLNNSKAIMKESSYKDYQYRLNRFNKWLNERGFAGKNVSEITKKTALNFLNADEATATKRLQAL